MLKKLPNNGSLTIITGPMFAGKTEELLRQIRRAHYAQKKFLIFRPLLDNRYSTEKIVSHLNNSHAAISLQTSQEIFQHLTSETEIIFLDELQFFDAQSILIIKNLVQEGYQVIAAGLDRDFRGEAFPITAFLLALAEKVIKLTSICRVCQR